MKRKFSLFLLAALLVSSLAGCGSASGAAVTGDYDGLNKSADMAGVMAVEEYDGFDNTEIETPAAETAEQPEVYVDEDQSYNSDDAGFVEGETTGTEDQSITSNPAASNPDVKLIWTGEMEIQTKEYDKTLVDVNTIMEKYNGFISASQSVDADEGFYYGVAERTVGRTMEMQIRVPSDDFQSFFSEAGEVTGTVTVSSASSWDATRTYNDNEQQLELLRAEYEYYETLLDNATELDEIIKLQGTMTDLLSRIKSLETSNMDIDYDANYATVSFRIIELVSDREIQQELKIDGDVSFYLQVDETEQIQARVVNGELDIEYWSDDDGVVTVDETGLLKAVGAGYARVHVTAGDLEKIIDVNVEALPPTYGNKLSEAFHNSWDGFVSFWQGLLLLLAGGLFQIVIIAGIVVVIVLLARRSSKKRKARMEQARANSPWYQKSESSDAEKSDATSDTKKSE